MWIPVEIRRKILRHFFEDGVLAVEDVAHGTHRELKCLNLYVYNIGRSFTSRGWCKKQYAWSTAYFILNDEGIAHLREYFGLPEDVAPKTLMHREPTILEHRMPRRDGERGPRRDGERSFRGDRPPRQEGDRPGRGTFRRNTEQQQ